MRAPDFWHHDNATARLLSPLAAIYGWAAARRLHDAKPFRAPIPVICVGNIVAGGAGKTPVCLAVAERLRARGLDVHLLTRGYGGTEAGPRLVDPLRHDAFRVGDEALLLAQAAPTWVARWRPDGAVAAAEMGAGIVVMDDGFQNGTLAKNLSLVVIDGGYGFGNGRVIPAGPCREPIAAGLARADAVVLIGPDGSGVLPHLAGKPVLRAHLVPGPEAAALRGRKVVAFAGIGRPAKFFQTLRECGAELVATRSFADHHPYGAGDLAQLAEVAERQQAALVTTAKDLVRVPPGWRGRIQVLTVRLAWEDIQALDHLLDRLA